MAPDNPAETIARHALAVRWDDLPAAAQVAAKAFVLDTAAVGLAGVKAAYADVMFDLARSWGAVEGGCAVWGRTGVRLPAPAAAFVNAFQAHGQEFDCVHEPAVLHPMTAVLPALLAEAERGPPISGAELLCGAVAGVEVAVSLGVAATTPLKFFRPATAGVFGATAALCRLRRTDLPSTLDALGYALAFASGTMQAHTEGKPALPVQLAHAARSALVAFDLARAGVPGPQRALDGPFGYFPLFETGYDLDRVLPRLGRPWRIEQVSWKPFPSGRATHGAVVATQTLVRRHGVRAETLDRLTYRAPPLINHLCGRPMVEGMAVAHARLCIPYCAALVITSGTVELADFTPERLNDPALLALARRIRVEVDDNPDPAAFTPATAIARLADGREARVDVTAQLGSPAWPLTRDQAQEKVRACLRFADAESRFERLVELVDRLEAEPDAGRLARVLNGDAR